MQRDPNHLGRVDDPRLDQVAIAVLVCVVALGLTLHVSHPVDHHGAVKAGVFGDRPERGVQNVLHDLGPQGLVAGEFQLVDRLDATQQGHTAARHDSFLQGRLGRRPGILQQRLAFLHFGLGGRPAVDLRHAAGQLGQPFLEFLAIVIAVGNFHLLADLFDPAVDRSLAAGAADHRRVVGVYGHFLDGSQVRDLDPVELHAQVLEDWLGASESGDVAQHGLSSVAVAGRLDGTDVENTPQLVDHQGRQGLALDVFGDHQQRLAGLAYRLQQGHQVLRAGDFLFVYEHQTSFQFGGLNLLIGNEMGREEAAVELHPLDHLDVSLGLATFLDGNHAVLAHLHKGVGQHLPDRRVVVAGNGGHLGDLFLAFLVDGPGHLLHRLDHRVGGLVDTPAERHRIGPAGHHPQTFFVDRFGQYGGGGRPVAGRVVCLGGRFLDQLDGEVLVRVVQVDVLGHGHAVLGHFRRAPALVQYGVAAAGAKGAGDGPGQFTHADSQRLPSLVFEDHLLCHSGFLLLLALDAVSPGGRSVCRGHTGEPALGRGFPG